MKDQYQLAINEMLKSFGYLIEEAMKKTTKCYSGVVISNNNDGRWNIKYNGEVHPVKGYGGVVPTVNSVVKVFVPQGNQSLAWFFIPGSDSGGGGGTGKDGVTFFPSVSEEGIISWTNNGNLPNPDPVNIMGPQGPQGIQGEIGPQGPQGQQGEQGIQGAPGQNGQDGADALINGVNSLTINTSNGITGTQSGNTYTISGSELETNISNIINGNTVLPYLKSFTVNDITIPNSGWSGSYGNYAIDVIVPGINSNCYVMVRPIWSTDKSTMLEEKDSWGYLQDVLNVHNNGIITFLSYDTFKVPVNATIYYTS